jgi:electron transport complex protein RnfG
MSEVKTEKVQMDPKYIIKLTVTLFVTCLVVAAALGGVNAITKDKIEEINRQNTVKAMQAVVEDPDSTDFGDAMDDTGDAYAAASAAASAAGATLDSIYPVSVNGQSAGYAIKVVSSGSQGSIEMMVGVDGDNTVTGVSIVSNSETSGIGSKVMDNEPLTSGVGVLDQFVGKSAADGTLTVGSNVVAISGATVSSKGVTAGVNAALAAAGAIG